MRRSDSNTHLFCLAQCSGIVVINSELIIIDVVISFLDVLSDFRTLML